MAKATRQRGRCRACGHLAPLTKDGVVMDHWERAADGTAIPGQCDGVGQLAVGHEPAWYTAWRDRFESGDTIEDEQRLKLAGWEPVDGFPVRVTEPLRVRCIRCGVETDLILGDLVLAKQAPPVCRHPGGEGRNLTPEQRQDLRDTRRSLRDDVYETAAREAGWQPVDPRPAQEKTRWKLRCTTCGEVVMARVSKNEHTETCPHGLTADEQAAHDRFVAAGWEPLEHPMRGSMKTQWRIRCTACRYETHRAAAKKIRPCAHPDRTPEE